VVGQLGQVELDTEVGEAGHLVLLEDCAVGSGCHWLQQRVRCTERILEAEVEIQRAAVRRVSAGGV
jgi:hypothetical protein